jgi:hypothetical protein
MNGFSRRRWDLLGDETDFVYRLAERGHKACFVPSARVRHIVHPKQFAWRWMLRRFYRHGKTMFVFDVQRNGRHAAETFHVPRYMLPHLVTLVAAVPIVLLKRDRSRIFSHLRLIAYDCGAIRQSRALYQVSSGRMPGCLGRSPRRGRSMHGREAAAPKGYSRSRPAAGSSLPGAVARRSRVRRQPLQIYGGPLPVPAVEIEAGRRREESAELSESPPQRVHPVMGRDQNS